MFNGIHTVAVGVNDCDAAIEFFTETLRFKVRIDAWVTDTMRWVEVAPDDATPSIALLTAGGPPVGTDTGIRFTVDDARSAHERLSTSGVRVGEILDFGGAPPMLTFNDPDSNTYYAVASEAQT